MVNQIALPFSYLLPPRYSVQLVRESLAEPVTIETPTDVIEILKTYLAGADREHFVAMALDAKSQIIGIYTVSVGTLNMTVVSPANVFKPAILLNAASLIVAHNHPSGDPSPSNEDIAVTHSLSAVGKLLDIPIVDHVIIGDPRYTSLQERGLLS